MTSSSGISRSISFLFLFFQYAFFTVAKAKVRLPPNVTVPAIIVFGDSIVDAGNNNKFKTPSKCNFPPYGIDFDGGVPTGRFSNGRVPSDLLAEEIGIKKNVPAYLDPKLTPEDLLTGVTFASGGAGYIPLTNSLAVATSLTDQLKHFEEYLEKVKELVGEERKNFILANSLYMVLTASNDIANTYPILQYKYDVDTYTALMADSASSILEKLYGYGARRILVLGAPPIGCVPSQRTVAGGPSRECVERLNDAAKLFNSKLSATVDSLARTLPGGNLVYADIYTPLLDIIVNFQNYGFKVGDRGCCGTGYIEVTATCNKYTSTVCPNRDEFVFWDSFHPTERGYRVLVSKLVGKYVYSRPCSSSSSKLFRFIFFLSSLCLPTTAHTKFDPKPSRNRTCPALLVFGDSIIDTGNNNDIMTVVKCNFRPYGINFPNGVATGRFSDGKVPSDILAELLGIKETLPAYLDPKLKPEDLLTGVVFGSGGSGFDPLTPVLLSVISMTNQLNYFQEYKERLKGMLGEEKANARIAESLFFVVAGSDDIVNTYYGFQTRRFQYNLGDYTSFLADSATSFALQLHQYGARYIAIASLPPIGCLPSVRTIRGKFGRDCSKLLNFAAQLFNSKLSTKVDALSKTLPETKLVYIDVYTPMIQMVKFPEKYDFEVADKGCCGTGTVETVVLCNHFTSYVCRNVSAYLFWDSYHPTERAYRILTKELIDKYFTRFYD
ncbi:PREDICTED: GDSL esterase/lipase At1g20120-like [Tarenaya hassleriana]|uniref:GDSL esterase/lipase At1g20120-like n=1 Tax=Tarenaya hassleriana TaxID=28532 RepID=UPI00053C782C|nr:PREDICTED: GDSL esterase/lipase At1g20120-like [Tarenaya hassleriana]